MHVHQPLLVSALPREVAAEPAYDPVMDERQFRLETWRSEAHELFRANRAAIERSDRVLPIVATFALGGVAAGLAQGLDEVVLAAPIAIGVSLIYAQNALSDSLVMGLARLRIEQALRSELGYDMLMYETHVAPLRRAGENRSVTGFVVLAGLAFVGSSVAGIVVAADLGALAGAIFAAVLVAITVVLVLAVRDGQRLWSRAEDHYRETVEMPAANTRGS